MARIISLLCTHVLASVKLNPGCSARILCSLYSFESVSCTRMNPVRKACFDSGIKSFFGAECKECPVKWFARLKLEALTLYEIQIP